MKMPLNSLRAFAAVAAGGGVRQAARELGVSHSSVSRHVSELEAHAGVPLVERNGSSRSVELTDAGQRLAAAAQAAFKALDAALDDVREGRSPFAVTVATTASVAARWLLPLLPALARAHPRISLSVQVEPRVREPAETGADLAIRMGEGPYGVEAVPLMGDEIYPVVSRTLWEQAGKPGSLAAIGQLPLLHDRDPSSSWDRWRKAFGPATLDIRSGSRFASSDLVMRAAAQGLGVALARHRLIEDELASGTLVRPFGEQAIAIPVAYWVVAPQRPRPAVRTVIQWLRHVARTAPVERGGR